MEPVFPYVKIGTKEANYSSCIKITLSILAVNDVYYISLLGGEKFS